jgi:hypothetical protein
VALEDWVRGREFVNRQATVAATYTRELAPEWTMSLTESFDRWAAEEQRMGTQLNAPMARTASENEAFTRGIVTWSPDMAHSLAFGGEYSAEWFADPSPTGWCRRAPR